MLNYEIIFSRSAYLLGIELKVFWAVAFIYALVALLSLVHIITRSAAAAAAARTIFLTGVVLHAALIVLRTVEAGRAPFQTLYESLSWFAWTASITYLFVSRRWTVHVPALLVSGLSFGACLYALLSRPPGVEILSPPLQSYWFEWHVVLAFFSYAVFVVSASVESTYLILMPLLKRGLAGGYGLTLDNIEPFHSAAFKLAAFGFPLLTFAVFSGAAWANEAWGRYWSWDPKETWSLITWTVFTLYLHSKATPRFSTKTASVFNIIGFVCMMMTFLGVNWLAKLLGIPSLHVYAV